MRTEKLLNDLENLVTTSGTLPLTTKRLIEEDDIFQIIESLKETLPIEMEESRKIIAEKEEILAEAQRQADSLIEQAKTYINDLTEESEMVKQAHERAAQVIAESNQSSEELKNSSVTYASDVFGYVEERLQEALNQMKVNREKLEQTRRND